MGSQKAMRGSGFPSSGTSSRRIKNHMRSAPAPVTIKNNLVHREDSGWSWGAAQCRFKNRTADIEFGAEYARQLDKRPLFGQAQAPFKTAH
jgi:hypothetical protein